MYYIVDIDGRLIDQSQSCPNQAGLELLADECGLDELWVIKGERSGITYTRPEPTPFPTPKPRLVFGQPIPAELAEEPKPQNLSLWSTQ